MAELEEGQWETPSGLVLGPGTPFRVKDHNLWGTPKLVTGDTKRPEEHGDFALGSDFYAAKPVFLVVQIHDPDPAAILNTHLLNLGAAFAPAVGHGLQILRVMDEGKVWRSRGRPDDIEPPRQIRLKKAGNLEVRANWRAHDPLIYSDDLFTDTTGLGSITGGRTYPRTYPYTYGTATPGSIIGSNDGNVPTPWTGRITAGAGGLLNPRITLSGTPSWLEVAMNLNEGEFLDIDVIANSVLLNGAATRTGKLRRPGSRWFKIPKGPATLNFTGQGAGTFRAEWRHARNT